jgi:histidinol-phosphate aminotransferase
VMDEAYVDFAHENAMTLAMQYPHVLVARTFSKAYSLCFLRVGYMVGNTVLIEALQRIRDSYNVNGLGQAAAVATLDDLEYYRHNFARIITTREKFSRELTALGFEVLPSATNFIFARPPKFSAEQWLEKLRANNVLVRWFKATETRNYLRITIGTEREMRVTLQTIRFLLP